MKQKRKVKSLISSNDKSNVGLTALLCLLGGILVFGAVALFTSSIGVEAAGEGSMEYDNGIEDKVEVLLNFKMAEKDSLGSSVNEMEFTGGTFYMKGNAGIAVDYVADGSINGGNNVNYLGGQSDGANIASNNITIIGGQNAKVFQNNNNATSLGGIGNTVNKGSNKVAPVMLGGNGNEISENQEGSAIVGGNGNKITGGGAYDFILGGEGSQINGNNVIVGGKKVTVNGKSNLFAFSDSRELTPAGGNAFYLNVAKGLGLNMAARNSGVDSSGAVSFGAIDINVSCTSADVGVQGIWNGCLVGCTQKGADDAQKRWEMMDHGDECETQCEHNSSRCMVDPIQPAPKGNYTSYCTTNGVNTGNSTQCAANRLESYENVIFETYLIDSDTQCPLNIENKCVFRCNEDYHLTGDYAGNKMQNVRCYKDCVLPWNRNVKKQHNDVITGYNVAAVSCSNNKYEFPRDTGVLNLGTARSWTNKPGTKKSGGTSYESCGNYDHKQKLVCNNGDWYIADSDNKATKYKVQESEYSLISENCTLQQYKCDPKYNLTQSYIRNTGKDAPVTQWNNTDRGVTTGNRGVYELCLDWFPSNATTNETCKTGTVASNYHYKLKECREHYSTGTDSDIDPYVCMRGCSLTGLDGKAVWYEHNKTTTGYRHNSELCGEYGTGSCQPATITCNDGQWRMGSNKNGTVNNKYLYDDCELKPYVCEKRFNIKQSDRNYRQSRTPDSEYESHSRYELCKPWSAKDGNKFKCTEDEYQYDLIGCIGEYHTENNKYCIRNSKSAQCNTTGKPSHASYDYTYETIYWTCDWNGTPVSSCWSPVLNDCDWHCDRNYHLKGTFTCEYNTRTVDCEDYVALPTNAHWDGNGQGTQGWVGTWNSGDWGPVNGCGWSCDLGYEGGDCNDVITCTCTGNPQYSYCINTNVQIDEPAACAWECYYGDDGAGGCLPPTYSCQGSKPTGATLNSSSSPSNDSTNYFCNATSTAACAYTCPSGQECDGTSGCKDVTYSCQGSKPTGATLNSNTLPSNNSTNYFCDATSTAACSYTCPSGQKCNDAGNGCIQDQLPKKCSSTHYNCTNDGTASNKKATEGSDRYTWDCPDETGCYEKCEDGQTLHNGNCVNNNQPGSCGKGSNKDAKPSTTKPTSQLCSSTQGNSDVRLERNSNGSFSRKWTCYGSPNASCELEVPTAVFDRCHQGSTLNVSYSTYNGGSSLSPSGISLHDSKATATYSCNSSSCAINTTDVTEINSITNGGATFSDVGYSWIEEKDGVALVPGNYDSSLCPGSNVQSCNIQCGTDQYATCYTDDGTFYSNGTNQMSTSDGAGDQGNGSIKYTWRCDKPSRCTTTNPATPLLCSCTTKSCNDYSSYGYHLSQYDGGSYQVWPIAVNLPSGCYEGSPDKNHIACYRPEAYLTVDIIDTVVGYGEDINGNFGNCGCGFRFKGGGDSSRRGGIVEDESYVTLDICVSGEGTYGYNACKYPESAGCYTRINQIDGNFGDGAGATNKWNFKFSPYEDDHIVTVNLGSPENCNGSSSVSTCNNTISVFFGTTPCDGAELIDFVGSDGKTYNIGLDGCDYIVSDGNSCRYIIDNIPINMTSGYLRWRRKTHKNGEWITCEDEGHAGINSEYISFAGQCAQEIDVNL